MLDQSQPIMELQELRFPAYTSEAIFPSLVAMLWSSTNAGFKKRRLQRTEALNKYGIKKLLKISREVDKPHILKYICNIEIVRFRERKNRKRLRSRFFLIELGVKKNIPIDIVKRIAKEYFYAIL